jgi:hypothetical protein
MSESWQNRLATAQLQFFHLPDYYDARLIYSRRVAGAILSLIAEPEVPIGDVRQMADRLARLLSESSQPTAVAQEQTAVNLRINGSQPEARLSPTFAIAWRPVKPLPELLQQVVRASLSELAAQQSYQLRYLSVTAAIIHLVIRCPAGKTAAWAAYYLKSGINDEIHRQFGVKSSIWRKGFYAAESEKPLNEAELKMLLTA